MNALHRTLAGASILHSLAKDVNRGADKLTKAPAWAIITMKSEPRTRLAPHDCFIIVARPQNNRHFWGVAVAFFAFCDLAFLEVFRTMIVTVHFFM